MIDERPTGGDESDWSSRVRETLRTWPSAAQTMRGRWVPVALIVVATLALGLYPVDRGLVASVQRGDRHAGERRYSDALRAYEEAALRCPGCPQPHLRRGEVAFAQRRYRAAWQAYLAAIELGGISDEARVGLARLYVAQHSESRAIDPLVNLLARRPAHGDLWLQLGEAYLALGEGAPARDAFERALRLNVTERQRQVIHGYLGISYVETDARCALDHFVQVEAGPDPDLSRDAGWLVTSLRRIAGEEKSAQQQDIPALNRAKLGEALFRYGDLPLARRQLEAAIELEPAYADAYAYLGHVLSLLGEDALAVEHLERAIALEPAYTLPFYFLGMHYARQGRRITARDYLVQAHDLDPTNPAICVAVADTYLRVPNPAYAVAERWLHAAVDNAPDDVRFHLLLAHFYVDYMVDPAVRGVAVAQVAVSLSPENSETQETLGWAHYLAGNPDLALEPLAYARDLAPEEPRIHYRLGQVYRALGQPELARRSFQQAVDLDWHGPIGERARQSLD